MKILRYILLLIPIMQGTAAPDADDYYNFMQKSIIFSTFRAPHLNLNDLISMSKDEASPDQFYALNYLGSRWKLEDHKNIDKEEIAHFNSAACEILESISQNAQNPYRQDLAKKILESLPRWGIPAEMY